MEMLACFASNKPRIESTCTVLTAAAELQQPSKFLCPAQHPPALPYQEFNKEKVWEGRFFVEGRLQSECLSARLSMKEWHVLGSEAAEGPTACSDVCGCSRRVGRFQTCLEDLS